MMAKTKPKNWGCEEDARLHILWRKKSKNGKKPLNDTTKLDKPHVEAIRVKCFPERTNCINFGNTCCKKARAWNLAQTLAGSCKQEASDKEDDKDDEDHKPDEEEVNKDEVQGLADDLKEPAAAGDPDIDKSLAEQTRKMKVTGKRSSASHSMSCTYLCLMCDCVMEERRCCSVDFLVPTQAESNFKPAVKNNNIFALVTLVPEVFTKKRRLIDAHAKDAQVNTNAHKVTSFAETADAVEKDHTNPITDELELIGTPQEITLPFACEEEIVDWECQLHMSEENNCQEELDSNDHFNVLSVNLVSVEKKKKKKRGKTRVIGSPVRAETEDAGMEDASGDGGDGDEEF